MTFDFFSRFVIFAKPGSVVRRIAWLTIFGLVLSIWALILIIGVMSALNRNQRERTLAVEPHLTVKIPELSSVASIENHPVFYKAKDIAGAKVFAYEQQDVIIRTMDGRFGGAVARGVNWTSLSETLNEIRKFSLEARTRDAKPTEKPERGEVILGLDLARSLGIFEGDMIMVVPPESLLLPPSEVPKYGKVRVGRIISTNLADYDAHSLFYIQGEALRDLRENASRVMGIEIRLPNADHAAKIKPELSRFAGLQVQTWEERNASLFLALKLEKMMMGVFLTMAILVAGLSIFSVISLLISQKKKEIALLQAIGLSRQGIVRLFSRIGFLLGFLGISVGAILGLASTFYLQLYPLNVLPDIYYDSQIPAEVQPLFAVSVLIIALLFTYFGSFYSARSASGEAPALVLKGKN